jgi:hypothetical protein
MQTLRELRRAWAPGYSQGEVAGFAAAEAAALTQIGVARYLEPGEPPISDPQLDPAALREHGMGWPRQDAQSTDPRVQRLLEQALGQELEPLGRLRG